MIVAQSNAMAESGTPEDDLSVPRAALNKMIKELLPSVRVSNDSRELILNCCTEFIHLLSSEANDVCNKSLKKTISPEHVLAGENKSCTKTSIMLYQSLLISIILNQTSSFGNIVVFVTF